LPQAGQPLRVPELELRVAIRILKDRYAVFQEPVPGRPYYVRFKQLDTGLSVQGMTHNKGTAISPIFLLQILERFDISVPDFLESLNLEGAKKEVSPVRLGVVPKPTAGT
jgi:hypothetical protein